jgi:hypothetical protein
VGHRSIDRSQRCKWFEMKSTVPKSRHHFAVFGSIVGVSRDVVCRDLTAYDSEGIDMSDETVCEEGIKEAKWDIVVPNWDAGINLHHLPIVVHRS